MNTKNNQRFKESENKIIEAFFKLSKTKKINEISVLSICKEAQINPSTFYAHYEDIYDLMNQISSMYSHEMLDEEANENKEESDEFIFSKESICVFLKHIKKHKDFYAIRLSMKKEFPLKEGYDSLYYIISKKCKEKGITDPEVILYYFVGYQSSFTMILKRWVDQGCHIDENEISNIIYNCLPSVLKD